MVRTIEVSHWGNIAVEETFHVKHTGAELKVKYEHTGIVNNMFVFFFSFILVITR